MKHDVFVTSALGSKPRPDDRRGAALHGYAGIGDVRQGKFFELELQSKSADQARALAAEVADKLLANPVIESYRIEIDA